MAFITLHNLRTITKDITSDVDFESGSIYKKAIYFLNKFEQKELFAIKCLIENPEELVSSFYSPLKGHIDTRKYVFEREGRKNSFHSKKDCRLLNSKYENVKIPEDLKHAGVTIEEFREWFTGNMKKHFERKNMDVIVEATRLKFGIEVKESDFISIENSETIKVNNYDLVELENLIDDKVKKAGRYYYEHKDILQKYSLRTFLAYREEIIQDNETGLGDAELKQFLKDYDKIFKQPVKTLLIEWYKIKFNPDLEIEGNLLKQLNFKPCPNCCEKLNKPDEINESDIRFTQLMSSF